MTLNMTNVALRDLGRYHCVSKNELGITKGDFTLYGNKRENFKNSEFHLFEYLSFL